MGGGLAYVFMYLMMLTTFPRFKSMISSKHWKILHTVGGYWIWIIFFRTHLKKVVFQDTGYILLALLSIVMLLRLGQLFYRTRILKRSW